MGPLPENRLQGFMPMDDLEDVRDLTFTDIRGFQIKNTTGHRVGSVKDVFVDPNTLQPQFALLRYEKFLNFNTKSLLVPWSELTIGPEYVQTRSVDHLFSTAGAEVTSSAAGAVQDGQAESAEDEAEIPDEIGVTSARRGEFG